MSLEYTVLRQVEEKYSPPDMDVVCVAMVDDRLFIDIGKHEEGSTETKFTRTVGVVVDYLDFANAVIGLRRSVLRRRQLREEAGK